MEKWINIFIDGGAVTGVIAGIIAAIIQLSISRFNHTFTTKTKKSERILNNLNWHRDEIGKLIKDVSEIRVPKKTETNEDVIVNAYYLIVANFEMAKKFFGEFDYYKIKGYFNTLNRRYDQMQEIELGYEKGLKLNDSRRILIGEIEESKKRLLNILQDKENNVLSNIKEHTKI